MVQEEPDILMEVILMVAEGAHVDVMMIGVQMAKEGVEEGLLWASPKFQLDNPTWFVLLLREPQPLSFQSAKDGVRNNQTLLIWELVILVTPTPLYSGLRCTETLQNTAITTVMAKQKPYSQHKFDCRSHLFAVLSLST